MNNRLASERGPSSRAGNKAAPSLDANTAGYGVVSPPNLKIAFDDGDGRTASQDGTGRAPGAVVKTKTAKRGTRNDIRGGGFFSWLLNFALKVGFFYLAIGAFYSCSSSPLKFDYDPKDSRGHCRTLAHAKANLQPILAPHFHAAHAKAQPYTQPYIDAATPYATAAWKTARPYYKYTNKQARIYYKRNIDPLRKHYTKRGRAYIDPHIKTLNQHYAKTVEPHIKTTQRALKPYQDIYRRDVAPYLQHAYTRSLVYGSASYSFYVARVHPQVIRSLNAIHQFYVGHVDPAMRRAYALYVQPQVNKALAKVFGHRAHAVGSDAIKGAKQDASQARKDAKQLEKEKVAEAKASASRAVEDPTLIDRLNKAKDHVVGGPLAAEDPVASAASDAELAAETAGTKDELEAWERGLSKLLDEEYSLVMDRIADIRARFSEGLPERFNVITDDVETDVEGVLARLAKSFDKLRASGAPTSDKLQEGNALVEKQSARLERSRLRASQSISALYDELQAEEATAQRASVAEVDRYIAEATRAYAKLIKGVKFPQTKEEWEGWDSGLRVRSQLFAEELDGVRTGSRKASRGVTAIDTSTLGDVQRQISKLQKQTETLYDAALADLTAFAAKELASLGASGASAIASEKLSGATAALSSHASVASSVASSVLREGAKTAGVSVSPESPGEYAASAVDKARSGADAAASSASSLARGAAKSAGISVQPETAGEYVEAAVDAIKGQAAGVAGAAGAAGVGAGVAGVGAAIGSHASAASEAVSSQASAASSVASSVAREGAKSAGISVQPETPGEYIESAVDAIKSQAGGVGAAVGSQASAASSAASSVAREGAKSAGISVSPETPGEYVESVVDAVKSQAGDVGAAVGSQASAASSAASSVAREGAKSAGISVSPETPGEYVESAVDAIKSQAGGVGAAIGSQASAASEAVSSQASAASSVASSVAREGAKSADIPVQPETPGEYVESALSRAGDYASAGSSSLSSVLSSATAPSSSAGAYLSSASSLARQAGKSAGLPLEPETPGEYAGEVLSAASAGLSSHAAAASSAASDLASAGKSLAGVHPSPESPLETLASAAGLAADVLSEGAHHATRSAASALGARPTPESASEYAEAGREGVEGAGRSAGSALSEARSSASALAYGGRDEL